MDKIDADYKSPSWKIEVFVVTMRNLWRNSFNVSINLMTELSGKGKCMTRVNVHILSL